MIKSGFEQNLGHFYRFNLDAMKLARNLEEKKNKDIKRKIPQSSTKHD